MGINNYSILTFHGGGKNISDKKCCFHLQHRQMKARLVKSSPSKMGLKYHTCITFSYTFGHYILIVMNERISVKLICIKCLVWLRNLRVRAVFPTLRWDLGRSPRYNNNRPCILSPIKNNCIVFSNAWTLITFWIWFLASYCKL